MSMNGQNKEEMKQESRKEQEVCCPSCGAVYGIDLPSCPYCDATNPVGAEKAYMNKLGGIRRQLHGLHKVTAEETRRELKETGGVMKRAVIIILLILLAVAGFVKINGIRESREQKEDYLWAREAFPILDDYYAKGSYDEMFEMYMEAMQQEKPIWQWKHSGFCEMIAIMKNADRLLEEDRKGELTFYDLQNLLWCELSIKWCKYRNLTEEENAWVEERAETYLKDLEERFPMTEQEEKAFENDAMSYAGNMSLDQCARYLEDHQQ